jgi:hypothetical protein
MGMGTLLVMVLSKGKCESPSATMLCPLRCFFKVMKETKQVLKINNNNNNKKTEERDGNGGGASFLFEVLRVALGGGGNPRQNGEGEAADKEMSNCLADSHTLVWGLFSQVMKKGP